MIVEVWEIVARGIAADMGNASTPLGGAADDTISLCEYLRC